MKFIVTGATGLTASTICRLLLDRGDSVVAVTRRRFERSVIPGAELIVADCSVPGALEPHLVGCDVLVHVAGIHLAPAIAETRGIQGIGGLVVISTVAIASKYRRSVSTYKRGEEAIRKARPDAVIIRPTMIYGSVRDRNVHHVIRFAERFRFLPLPGGGRSAVQPIHYADLAAATVALAGRDVDVPVEAGGPRALTIREAAEAIFAALAMRPRFIPFPLRPSIPLARLLDSLSGLRVAERLQRMEEDRSVDNGRLTGLTGLRFREFSAGVLAEVREVLGMSRTGS